MDAPEKSSYMTRVLRRAKREIIPTQDIPMYLVTKYMRLPNFRKTPKIYKPLGMLGSDPIASI